MFNIKSSRRHTYNLGVKMPQKTGRLIRIKGGSKKERKVYKLIQSLDHFVVRILLSLIAVHIVSYGYLVSDGFTFGAPTWNYALILIPIWLIDGLKGLIEAFKPSVYISSTEDLSKVTVIVPTKDGGQALLKTLKDLKKRFAPENIMVVSNGSTDDSVAIAWSQGATCLDIADPIGKVKAINYALEHIKTPYALLIDDDTLIGNAHIPTGLLDKGYDAVAFRVLVNTSTWITKIQMYEYRKSTDIGKRFQNRSSTVPNISGAIGLFSVTELQRQVEHHTHEFAGEDLQRTLLVHLSYGSKGVVLTDSVVYTDPPKTIKELFNQRTLGWFPGLYTNFPNFIKLLFKKNTPGSLRFDAFYNAFLVMILDVLRLVSLPALIFYPWYFVIMYAMYISLETVTYFKSKSKEPFWVVLVYPFYGLFGYLTRICALGVFLYRRLVARLARALYFDDYKRATTITKLLTITVVVLLAENILLSYLAYIDIMSTDFAGKL